MAKNIATTSGIENFDSELQSAIQCTRGSESFAGFVRTQFSNNISYEMLVLKVETAVWTNDGASRAYSDDEKAEGKQALSRVRSRIVPADSRKIVKAAKAAAEKAKKGSGKNVTAKTLGLKSPQARTLTGSRIIALRMFALGLLVYNRIQNELDIENEQHKNAAAMCPVLTAKMSFGECLAALCAHPIVQTIERKNAKPKKIVHLSLDDQYANTTADNTLKASENSKLLSILQQATRQKADWPTAKKLNALTDSEKADKLKADKKLVEQTERATDHIVAALPDATKKGRLTELNSLLDMAEKELSTKKFKLKIPRRKTVKDGIAETVKLSAARESFAQGKQKCPILRKWASIK